MAWYNFLAKLGATSKRAKRVRQADEFDFERLTHRLRMPRDGRTTINAWSLDMIYQARELQMLGQFVEPARMVEQFRTDDALYPAWENRLAPQKCIPVEMRSVGGARADAIAGEGEALYGANGVGVTAGTITDIHNDLVNHGIAFGVNDLQAREDGSRVDLIHRYYPIEYIRWDPVFRVFKARCNPDTVQEGDIPTAAEDSEVGPYSEFGFVGGYWIPVIHGDGRWVIYTKHDLEPFRKEAVILPAALVWARHAFAARDWSKGSKSHGSAKVIGELPSGVPLQNEAGITAEAQAFISLLRAVATEDAPAGIRPAGSKTEFLTNTSTAWQVWSELMLNAEKAAARIYLGTDGTLGSQGGAPGVDIGQLFGVAQTKVRGDLQAISRGLDTGVIEPWCAMNFGDSKLAPRRTYILPNDELEKVRDNNSKRNSAYYAALKDAKEAGLTLTTGFVQELAGDYGVRVPQLSAPIMQAPVTPTQ